MTDRLLTRRFFCQNRRCRFAKLKKRVEEDTSWKINMEPIKSINQPFRKENDLRNLHDYVLC